MSTPFLMDSLQPSIPHPVNSQNPPSVMIFFVDVP